MKCMFSINMYSGAMPPERELKAEETQRINELVAKLDTPWKGGQLWYGLSNLSTDSYSVFWNEPFSVGNPYLIFDPFEGPWMGVQVRMGGPVHIWRKEENFAGTYLKDTVGLWEYLSTIGGPLLARHYRDSQEAMEDYYEKVLGIPYQTKI